MPKDKGNPNKDDPEYLAKRAKNNEAIKRSREKARQKVALVKFTMFLNKSNSKCDGYRLTKQRRRLTH